LFFAGDNVYCGILSKLDISTGIIACCSMTYRPLIERIFGTGHGTMRKNQNTIGSVQTIAGAKRTGWNKIDVEHDVELLSSSDS
jgi:hypothetical protein